MDISIHLMLLFIDISRWCTQIRLHFNTSHVTVYQLLEGCKVSESSFQYISCYCLSLRCNNPNQSAPSFQYISCYCLSVLSHQITSYQWHFNTSHVTVYLHCVLSVFFFASFQYISCYCLSCHSAHQISIHHNFNTSHVTVYPHPPP